MKKFFSPFTMVIRFACFLLFLTPGVHAQVDLDVDPRTCGFPCSSNDVVIGNAFLASNLNATPLPNTCIPETPVNAFICVEATNGTGSTRTKLIVAADVYVDGILVSTIQQCIDVNLPNNVLANFCFPAAISWTCGSAVELQNLYVGFYAAGGADACPPSPNDCSDYNQPAKCVDGLSISVSTPLVADFSYACAATTKTIQFTNGTSGGFKPYTYEWNFGDGSPTSSAANPSHQFAASTTYTVTLKVTDSRGTMDTQSYQVDVGACCELEVECPNAVATGTFDCNNPIPAPVTTVADFENTFGVDIGDNPCGTIVITSEDSPINVCSTTSVERIYTIFDDLNGNGMLDMGEASEICSITYNFTPDNTAPTLTKGTIAACYTAEADAEAAALAATSATDNCTDTDDLVFDVSTTGTCNAVIRVTVTDQCNRSNFVEYQTSIDNEDPSFASCPANPIDLGCNPSTFPTEDEIAALVGAQDNCGLSDVSVSPGTITGTCNKSQTFTVTATDNCNNSTNCQVTYTWKADTEDPVLQNCPAGGDLGCNPLPTAYAASTATWGDNCGLKETGVRAGTPSNDGCEWTVTHEYYAIDNCDNESTCTQTFTWTVDTQDPTVVACPAGGDLGFNPAPTAYAPGTAQWSDNCGLKQTGVRPGTPTNDGCNWTVTHEYYAIDNCNNEATCTQTFTWIVDGGAPTLIDCPDGGDLGCNPDPSEYAPTAAVWDDECGTIAEEGVRAGTPSNDGCEWTVTHEYYAIDEVGNENTCTQTFTWTQDTEDPQLVSCPAGGELGCNPSAAAYAPATATWTDNCGVKNKGVRTGTPTRIGCNWTVTHEYYAVDNCGNEATCTQTFTWTADTEDPQLVSCPAGGNLGCNPDASAYAPGAAQWTDNCGLQEMGVREGIPTNNGCNWTVTHEYYAIDNCDNERTCTQTFTWKVDTEAPTCVYTGAIPTLTCGVDVMPDLRGSLSKSDNCSAANKITVVQNPAPGTPIAGSLTVTFSVTDECNNTGTCELSISCIPPSGGCTYTPGYWKNHAEDICVENIPCVGNPLKAVAGNGNNPWVILARAYAAAYLNKVCAEASVESIQAEFDKAANLLCTYDQAYAARLRGSARAEWTALANKIDLFNNGLVGPPHCTTPLSNLNSKEEGPKLNIHTELDVIAFPNPFTQSTTIRFVVAYDSQVTIDVFNTAGQQITTLFKGKVAANVTQDVLFSPDKADGEIYFYRITTERGTTFGKLVSTQ